MMKIKKSEVNFPKNTDKRLVIKINNFLLNIDRKVLDQVYIQNDIRILLKKTIINANYMIQEILFKKVQEEKIKFFRIEILITKFLFLFIFFLWFFLIFIYTNENYTYIYILIFIFILIIVSFIYLIYNYFNNYKYINKWDYIKIKIKKYFLNDNYDIYKYGYKWVVPQDFKYILLFDEKSRYNNKI